MILLIHPPSAKPCEPPAGIARLAGALRLHGIPHQLLDLNMEGLVHRLQMPPAGDLSRDAWSRRAFANRDRNLAALRDPALYATHDRYRRAVRDLERVLARNAPEGYAIGLADYAENGLSPLRSSDLMLSAEHPENNPWHTLFRERLVQMFRSCAIEYVGISLNFLSQALSAFALIGLVRKIAPATRIILGGGLVTSWGKRAVLQDRFSGLVDEIVTGPGELPLLRILGIDAPGGSFPRPDYTMLPTERYLSPGFVLPYSASSGCYWNRCDFCPERAEGNTYTPVPPRQVIDDLECLARSTRPRLIHLLDNAVSPALLETLCSRGPGLPWYGFVRTGPHLTDPSFCRALKTSGCSMLKIGIESGDQSVLDRLDKGIDLASASLVLKNLKRAGIATYVYLLFGTPQETEYSARKTLAFTAKHHDCISFLNLAIFNMPVCGHLPPHLEPRSFSAGDLSLYTDFVHPHGWDRKHVRRFLDREFRRHPAVAPILRRVPPVFTSNHAPFFAGLLPAAQRSPHRR